MMKGFPGAAGPRKGADQTVAGLFRRAPQRIVLRAADRKRSGPGWSEAEYVGQSRIVGVGSDVGPHFACVERMLRILAAYGDANGRPFIFSRL